jgi:hypothetical protein
MKRNIGEVKSGISDSSGIAIMLQNLIISHNHSFYFYICLKNMLLWFITANHSP